MPVPTIEAIHTWDGTIALNDRGPLDPATRRYRYWCTNISGLRDLPDAELPSQPRIGALGVTPRRGSRGGKVATYEGRIEGLTRADVDEARDLLLSACLDVATERRMDIAANPAFGTEAFFFSGRAHATTNDLPPDSINQAPTPHRASFVVAVALSDPRIYGAVQVGPFTTSAFSGDVGWTLPVALPRAIPAPAGGGGTVDIDNTGRAPTPVTIDVYGPVTQPTVENLTDGRVLMLDYTVDQDRYVRLDLATGSATLDDGTDLQYTVMYPESTWLDGDSGLRPNTTTTVRLSGVTIADPARAEVTFYPAHA